LTYEFVSIPAGNVHALARDLLEHGFRLTDVSGQHVKRVPGKMASRCAAACSNSIWPKDGKVLSTAVWAAETGRDAEDGRRPVLRRVHRWEIVRDVLDPVAGAAADLICNQDFRLIRSREGSVCVLVFLDRTKAHARRWCSMRVCGIRAELAAHRARRARNQDKGLCHCRSRLPCARRSPRLRRSAISRG
jgi:hypothetical protein